MYAQIPANLPPYTMRSLLLWPFERLEQARGTLFLWVPVLQAFGIAGWFALNADPSPAAYALICGAGLICLWVAHRQTGLLQPVWIAAFCVTVGFLLSGFRAWWVAAPILPKPYYGPVQGRIVDIDRSQNHALRFTLDRVVLADMPPEETPHHIRISHQSLKDAAPFPPGTIIQLTARLAPPEGPTEPGGFDFQSIAWFERLGALGYTRHPILVYEPPTASNQTVARLRSYLSGAIQTAIAGDAGAFAAGVMTGDRAGLSLQAVNDLRHSSLAHLLAISGMNLAFLVGFVFALIRYGIALFPWLALRINAKKMAACCALPVAAFYLLLSGSNIATERAFIMVCVMLGAVLCDRRALSLRSIALSATILLALRPESLFDPGFQMSFAATTALIYGFAGWQNRALRHCVPFWLNPIITLILSSLLAGVATAPYGAAHFNRIADYGFIANLLTVPVMGLVVMPAGAIAALLAPFGLAALPLWIMGQGSAFILWVANEIAQSEGAVSAVPSPAPWVLTAISLGGICLILWPKYYKLIALVPLCAALYGWSHTRRPLLLISSNGALSGLMGPEGRALSQAKGSGFIAKNWLENDGDLAPQKTAAGRTGFTGGKTEKWFYLGPWQGVHVTGKNAVADPATLCQKADLVITDQRAAQIPAGCTIIDQTMLAQTGALAINIRGNDMIITPTIQSHRIWHVTHSQTLAPIVKQP